MSTSPAPQPPVHVEQWLDFVIASAAHRSHDSGHQKFGADLVTKYFVALPERYKEDPVASRYFDDMICAAAAAVRGFSISRDVFQTNWESLKTQRDIAQKHVDRLDTFGPLNKEGIWGKIGAAIIGIGLGAPITQALQARWENMPFLSLLLVAALVGVSFFAIQAAVEWMRGKRLKSIETQLPLATLNYWEEKTLKSYRTVLRQFFPLAVEITNRHYPGSFPDDLSEDKIAEIVERHFAFKLKNLNDTPTSGTTH